MDWESPACVSLSIKRTPDTMHRLIIVRQPLWVIASSLLSLCFKSVAVSWLETFWYRSRSRSAESYLLVTDPDPDVALFVSDLQDGKDFLHHFPKIKSHKKKSQNSRNKGFSYYICLDDGMDWSGSGSVPDPGSPKTYGSGTLVFRHVLLFFLCARTSIPVKSLLKVV